MKFTCDLCQFAFTTKSNLRRHQRNLHKIPMILRRKPNTPMKDMQCSRCLSKFTLRSNLKKHLVSIHKIKRHELKEIELSGGTECSNTTSKLVQRLSAPSKNKSNLPLSLDIFECAHCGDIFCRKNLLIHHMKVKHLSFISDYAMLENILPDWPGKKKVFVYYVINKERRHFVSKFSINLKNKIELNQWLSKFQDKNKITLRKCYVRRSVNPSLLYQMKFACNYHSKPKRESVNQIHPDCPAYMVCKIFSNVHEENNYAEISISHIHNHKLDSKDVLKFCELLNEEKNKRYATSTADITPAEALQQHKKDLNQQYAADFPKILVDRGDCPNRDSMYCIKAVSRRTSKKKSGDYIANCVSSTKKSWISEDGSKLHNIFQVLDSKDLEEEADVYSTRNNVTLNDETLTFQELTDVIQLSDQSVDSKLRQSLLDVKDSSIGTCDERVVPNEYFQETLDSNIVYEETFSLKHVLSDLQLTEMNSYRSEKEVDDIFKEFDEMNTIIKQMAGQNDEIMEGLIVMILNFRKNLNNADALNTAIRNFGILQP